MPESDHKPRCHAHNRFGEQCRRLSVPGGRVCRWHGGKAPQVLAKADQRMRELVPPALASLERLINKDEFPATKYVLDYAGFRPADQTQQPTGAMHVTVTFDRADQDQLALEN